jgi:hypothetical protein
VFEELDGFGVEREVLRLLVEEKLHGLRGERKGDNVAEERLWWYRVAVMVSQSNGHEKSCACSLVTHTHTHTRTHAHTHTHTHTHTRTRVEEKLQALRDNSVVLVRE